MPEDTRIRLVSTSFVIYHHADLVKAKEFLVDFGLIIVEDRGHEIFFRGHGLEPVVYIARQASSESSFGGAAYLVESRAELERAAALPSATAIAKLDAPGGGEVVTLTDPVGFKVHLVHGRAAHEPDDLQLQKLTVNYEDEKPRRGRFHRFEAGPASVHKWGHYGVTYPEGRYKDMYDWYTRTLTLAPSDVVLRGETPVTCFLHIDRGMVFTDHHSFFFKPAKAGQKPSVAHAAFEVHDFDIQQLGHQHLKKQGYELCWGVGRVGLDNRSSQRLVLTSGN